MFSLFTILGFGFLLGLRHAIDADHVVAVTTLLGKHGKIGYSAIIGILWGIGHSITVTLIAIPIIFFSFVVPKSLGTTLEFLVGAMLVALGVFTLSGVTKKISGDLIPLKVHKHLHISKTEDKHSHFHLHILNSISDDFHHIGTFQTVRPIVIGLIHGLAGSAAIALLVLSTINSPSLAALYLFIFHLGVIVGMMIITALLGASIILIRKKSKKIHQYLIKASGILSLSLGLYIMYQIAFVDRLFY